MEGRDRTVARLPTKNMRDRLMVLRCKLLGHDFRVKNELENIGYKTTFPAPFCKNCGALREDHKDFKKIMKSARENK